MSYQDHWASEQCQLLLTVCAIAGRVSNIGFLACTSNPIKGLRVVTVGFRVQLGFGPFSRGSRET